MADTVQKKKEYHSSLGAVPLLKGESNYEEWYRRIVRRLELHDLLPMIQGTAVEPPSNTDEHRDWRHKQITGLEVIEGAVSESIRDRLAASGKPRDSIKDLLDSIRSLCTAQGLVHDYQIWNQWLDLNRKDYTSLEAYTEAFVSGMRKSNAASMPISRKQAHARLLHAVEEEFPIWTANRREAARRVTREDDLITIEELVSDLMDESRTRPDTSFAMSSVSKNPPRDDQSKSNTEESTSKELERCSHCNGKHPGGKERCFYLHPELRYPAWRPYKKHILCIDPPQEEAETTSNSNQQVGTTGRGSAEGLFISSMAVVDDLGDSNQDDWFLDSCSNITISNNQSEFIKYETLSPPYVIATSGGTIHYAIGKGTVHIPILMDDGNTCTVATEAYYAPKSPHKLLSESSLEKRKQLYIGPDKETGGRTILRYSDDLVVGRATCKNGLYVVRRASKPQYIAHASTAKRQISRPTSTAKETTKALRAFEKADQQSTANSLLAGRENMIPTIAKGDEGYNHQDDVDSDDSGVYRIDQQLEGGVETEAARPKKVSYTAVAFSSYAHIQPTPPEPHPKAPYKIKIPRTLKEAPQSPEAPRWRKTLTVEMTQHKKAKTHRFGKRPKEHHADIKLRKVKDIEQGVDQPADGLTKAYQRTPIRRSKKVSVPPKSPGPPRPD